MWQPYVAGTYFLGSRGWQFGMIAQSDGDQEIWEGSQKNHM
jgi:hypothetical protein